MMSDHAVHFSSKSGEHLTPPHIVEAVVNCLGTIDLDPCAETKADPVVPALRHYTVEDNGLARPWHGSVYMNSPYGREIAKWVAKLNVEHQAGRVREAIALTPARTDTRWWQALRDRPVCLVRGRLKFVREGNTASAPFPSAIFYLGPATNLRKFRDCFAEIGDVWVRVK
jgi:hypothetical protein